MKYGYARISTRKQNLERQIRSITEYAPTAKIYQETYTGTKDLELRPEWRKLMDKVQAGDTIIFDSVSRMSRNAEEGFRTYCDLSDKGVNLVFLKEHYCDTDTYQKALKNKIEMTGSSVDCILKGINEYFRILAKEQIQIAFAQAEKEVQDNHDRTVGGLQTARLQGKKLGQTEGAKLETLKSFKAKEIIFRNCKVFGGSLSDAECMKLADVSRNTYFKYKAEIKADIANGKPVDYKKQLQAVTQKRKDRKDRI